MWCSTAEVGTGATVPAPMSAISTVCSSSELRLLLQQSQFGLRVRNCAACTKATGFRCKARLQLIVTTKGFEAQAVYAAMRNCKEQVVECKCPNCFIAWSHMNSVHKNDAQVSDVVLWPVEQFV